MGEVLVLAKAVSQNPGNEIPERARGTDGRPPARNGKTCFCKQDSFGWFSFLSHNHFLDFF